MANLTGFLVYWGVAWNSGRQWYDRGQAAGLLLEDFHRINHLQCDLWNVNV